MKSLTTEPMTPERERRALIAALDLVDREIETIKAEEAAEHAAKVSTGYRFIQTLEFPNACKPKKPSNS